MEQIGQRALQHAGLLHRLPGDIAQIEIVGERQAGVAHTGVEQVAGELETGDGLAGAELAEQCNQPRKLVSGGPSGEFGNDLHALGLSPLGLDTDFGDGTDLGGQAVDLDIRCHRQLAAQQSARGIGVVSGPPRRVRRRCDGISLRSLEDVIGDRGNEVVLFDQIASHPHVEKPLSFGASAPNAQGVGKPGRHVVRCDIDRHNQAFLARQAVSLGIEKAVGFLHTARPVRVAVAHHDECKEGLPADLDELRIALKCPIHVVVIPPQADRPTIARGMAEALAEAVEELDLHLVELILQFTTLVQPGV